MDMGRPAIRKMIMRDVRRLRASTFLTKGKSRNDSAARQCWLTENCRIGAHLAGRLNGVAYSQYYIGLSRASARRGAARPSAHQDRNRGDCDDNYHDMGIWAFALFFASLTYWEIWFFSCCVLTLAEHHANRRRSNRTYCAHQLPGSVMTCPPSCASGTLPISTSSM